MQNEQLNRWIPTRTKQRILLLDTSLCLWSCYTGNNGNGLAGTADTHTLPGGFVPDTGTP